MIKAFFQFYPTVCKSKFIRKCNTIACGYCPNPKGAGIPKNFVTSQRQEGH